MDASSIDFAQLEKYASAFQRRWIAPLSRRAAVLAKEAGVERFLWVSSVGASPR